MMTYTGGKFTRHVWLAGRLSLIEEKNREDENVEIQHETVNIRQMPVPHVYTRSVRSDLKHVITKARCQIIPLRLTLQFDSQRPLQHTDCNQNIITEYVFSMLIEENDKEE